MSTIKKFIDLLTFLHLSFCNDRAYLFFHSWKHTWPGFDWIRNVSLHTSFTGKSDDDIPSLSLIESGKTLSMFSVQTKKVSQIACVMNWLCPLCPNTISHAVIMLWCCSYLVYTSHIRLCSLMCVCLLHELKHMLMLFTSCLFRNRWYHICIMTLSMLVVQCFYGMCMNHNFSVFYNSDGHYHVIKLSVGRLSPPCRCGRVMFYLPARELESCIVSRK